MKTKLWAFKLFAVFLLMTFSKSWGQTAAATYTVSTTSTVTTSGNTPAGSTASYTQTYNTAKQLTGGNSATLTLNGYAGYNIHSITLNMRSNTSSGAGTLSITSGTNSLISISPAANFNNAQWYGAWSTSYVDIVKNLNTAYLVQAGEQIKIVINATANSLYIGSYTINYSSPATTAPVVTASTQTAAVGTPFSYQIQASENPTSYAISSGTLPVGLNLDTATGLISGTPTSAGTFSVDVTAANAVGTSAPATVSFTVNKGDQTVTGFNDNTVNFANTPSVTLPLQTDQGNTIIYTSSNPAIATVSGNILTFLQTGTVNVTASEAGNANYNAFSITKVFSAFSACFNEDFASITSGNSTQTSGSGTNWDGNTNFPTVASAYQAGGAVKLGSGSATGSITSAPLSLGGDLTVNFDVKGWSTVEGTIIVTLGGTSQTVTYSAVMGGSFEPKSLTFTNVPLGSTLKIETSTKRAFIDNVNISCGNATIWDGTNWSNGIPNSSTVAAIAGDYAGNDFESAALTVLYGKTLTITGNIAANGNVVNNGAIIVNDSANFIQSANATYTAGTGSTFTLNKAFETYGTNKYSLWSSPVTGHNYFNMYGSGNTPGFVTTYQTATDAWINTSADAPFAAVKIPSPITAPSMVTFEGVPNNGIVTAPIAVGGMGNYNLVGNPYPSNFSLPIFYNTNSSKINSTFWFWNNNTTQQGSTGNNQGYATFNAASSSWVPAPSAAFTPTSVFVAPTQGFIVEAIAAGDVTFDNSMRNVNSGTFFNKTSAAEGKFWLKLTSPDASVFNTQAITYNLGASNGYDAYDSKSLNTGAHDFYSMADSHKVIIQGRAPFTPSDVVALGAKFGMAGNYIISLTQTEGLFAGNQPVYLYDKLTGSYTDLKLQSYTFNTVSGTVDNRFEIVYLAAAMATTESVVNDGISISKDGTDFIVTADSKIESVTVTDAAGRIVKTISGKNGSMTFSLPGRGVYVVQVKTVNGEIAKKIIN